MYSTTQASGDAQEVTPGDKNAGTLTQGYLEMSNVELVDEMVGLIVGQRAYEANSKSITTADGMDIAAAEGDPVSACWNGTVVFAGVKSGYGNVVEVAHPGGWKSIYGHLRRYSVRPGDTVRAGGKIAEVGSTGRSTGPHLHFELRHVEDADITTLITKLAQQELAYQAVLKSSSMVINISLLNYI